VAIDPAYLGLWVPDVKAYVAEDQTGFSGCAAGAREDRYLSSQTSSIRQPL
jgi:hypothetical protein